MNRTPLEYTQVTVKMQRSFVSPDVFEDEFADFMLLAQEYMGSYDDPTYFAIASAIVRTLVYDVGKPLTNEDHPFYLYADEEGNRNNIPRLASVVLKQFDTQDERQISVAFFHPGGSQRLSLEELMEQYYTFADNCTVDVE